MSLVDIYRKHAPKLALFDDAKDILSRLKEMKYRLGMITDGLDTVQKSKVHALDIEQYFSSIIYTHELGVDYYKPHPLPYITMAKNLNCAYNDMVYVGDNPHKDFVAAKRLGITTVRLMRGPFAHVAVDDEYDAQVHLDSFHRFEERLKNCSSYADGISGCRVSRGKGRTASTDPL
jgi:putative hydrolase of the HAD superfamily